MSTSLYWLPVNEDWRTRLRGLANLGVQAWPQAIALAKGRLDFLGVNALDAAVRRELGADMPDGLAAKPIRLALLGSCTMAHLQGALRVAGLRRNIHITLYENDYGQYWQELSDAGSPALRIQTQHDPVRARRPSSHGRPERGNVKRRGRRRAGANPDADR